MADAFFSFTPLDFSGLHAIYSPFESFEKEEAVIRGKHDHLFGIQDLEEFRSFSEENGFYDQEEPANEEEGRTKEQQPCQTAQSNYLALDEFQMNNFSTTARAIQECRKVVNYPEEGSAMVEEPEKVVQSSYPSSLASLELLSNYGGRFRKMRGEKLSKMGNETDESHEKLSAEEIMRVAGERYVQYFPQGYDDFQMPMHRSGFAFSGLSDEETKDVELVHMLLAAAEKVSYQQFERASRLLLRCQWVASARGDPVQRVVFYFTEALRQRIQKETGRMIMGSEEEKLTDIAQGLGLSTDLLSVKFHQTIPFNQVMQFAGIQVIIEHAAFEKKVHIIDLEIRCGVQWTVLMQALAEREEDCPIELLKITAVGLTGRKHIEETGRRLATVAESFNLPFSFEALLVSDMTDLQKELIEVEEDEMVAVYSSLLLRTMISRADCLDKLMTVIRDLSPSIMVVVEVEANYNSPSFVNRFVEALFFYTAYFDCLEACMKQSEGWRVRIEELFSEGIQNIVASEGSERVIRSVKINVWRMFLARFKMEEVGLSESSVYQASLVLKQFACGNSCTLDKDGKCLTVGWKGTPIFSLSAWKFH